MQFLEKTQSKLAQVIKLLTFTREEPFSNLCWDTDYRDWRAFLVFLSIPPGKFPDSTLTKAANASFHNLSDLEQGSNLLLPAQSFLVLGPVGTHDPVFREYLWALCFEMVPPVRREEGLVFLGRCYICCTVILTTLSRAIICCWLSLFIK
jgi:hypothetical protein